jgi:hypothetical protein
VHPKEAEYLYGKFLLISGGQDYVSDTQLVRHLAVLRPIIPWLFAALADKETKKISFVVFVNYLLISTRGTPEEKTLLTCKILNAKHEEEISKKQMDNFLRKVLLITKPDSVKATEIHYFIDNDVFDRPELDVIPEIPISETILDPIPLDVHRVEEITKPLPSPIIVDHEGIDRVKIRSRRPSDILGYNVISSGRHLELDLKVGSMDRRERIEPVSSPIPEQTPNIKDNKKFSLHQHLRTNSMQEYNEFIAKFTPTQTTYDMDRFISATTLLSLAGRTVRQRIETERIEREKMSHERKSLQLVPPTRVSLDYQTERRNSEPPVVEKTPKEVLHVKELQQVIDTAVESTQGTYGAMCHFIKIGQTIRNEVFEKKSLFELAREKRQELGLEFKLKVEEKAEEFRDRAQGIRENIKEFSEDIKGRAMEFREDIKERALEFREDIKERALEIKEDLKERTLEFRQEITKRSESVIKLKKIKGESQKEVKEVEVIGPISKRMDSINPSQ